MTAEQPSLFDVGTVSSRQFEPVRTAVEGATAYTHGRYSSAGLANVRANPRRGFAVQAAYRQAEGAPEHAGIRKSYAAMEKGVNDQYDFMTRPKEQGGMGIKHEVVPHDPYSRLGTHGTVVGAQEMADDIRGGHIKTMSTEATGGHAFFSNETNDRFRAVHDVFGHAATGRGVSRHGEEAAFLSHRQMFSRTALPALASETRGQNSYLNYGQTQGNPEKAFPDQSQKLIGLPAFAHRAGSRVR